MKTKFISAEKGKEMNYTVINEILHELGKMPLSDIKECLKVFKAYMCIPDEDAGYLKRLNYCRKNGFYCFEYHARRHFYKSYNGRCEIVSFRRREHE